MQPVTVLPIIDGTTYIKLYFHLYSGEQPLTGLQVGPDIQRCRDMRDVLNTAFEPHGFQFFFNECEVTTHDEGILSLDGYNAEDYLCQPYVQDDGIVIHARADIIQANRAQVNEIGGNQIIIGGSWNETDNQPISISSVLPHEMGHCLGLFHTYRGDCTESYSEYCPVSTSTNYKNPNSEGDFIDDTPPDVYGKVNNQIDCIYDGLRPVNGSPPDCLAGNYNPLTNNFMSSYGQYCPNSFTQGQVEKMHRDALPEIQYDYPNSHGLTVSIDETCTKVLSASISCNENPVSYLWSTGATSPNINVTTDGTYTVTVTDDKGNLSIKTVEFTDELLEVNIDDSYISGCGGGLSIITNVSGGNPPYTYSWNTGETSANILTKEPCEQSYSVTVTDANGCQVFANLQGSIKYASANNPQLIDQDIVFNGLYHILSGGEVTITSTVRFGEGGGIVVERGGKLILDGGTLTKCDGIDRWLGIFVEGNSNQIQPDATDPAIYQSQQSGIVVTKNNATISYAKNGIFTNREPCAPWSPDYWGGLVHCENTDFLHCDKAIAFMKYDFPNKSRIINCTFDGRGTADGTSEGITIWECDEIEITESRFYNHTSVGIGTIDAGTHIYNGNNFKFNHIAIYGGATYPFGSYLYVGKASDPAPNYFDENWIDIQSNATDRYQGLKVINNEFFDAGYLVTSARGAHKLRFEENSLHKTNGILMTDMGAFGANQNNFVKNNSFFDMANAIAIRGLNKELQILCNDFSQTVIDEIYLSDFGADRGEIRRRQGVFDDPTGNCFDLLPISDDIETVGNTKLFEYYYRTGIECQFPTNPGNYYAIGSTIDPDCSPLDEVDGNWTTINDSIDNYSSIDSSGYYDLVLQKNQIISHIIDSLSDVPTQLFQWLSGQDDEILNLWAFGVLMQEGDYTTALSYLNTLNSEDQDWIDFVSVQQINISLLGSLETYELSDSEENFLLNIAEGNSSAAPYARSILQRELGIYITDEWPTHGSIDLRELDGGDMAENHAWVSPNPFINELQLNLKKPIKESLYNFSIFNLHGIEVMRIKNLEPGEHRINLSSLKSGVYILDISIGKASQKRIKIVKS